jgi:hypothetical protein
MRNFFELLWRIYSRQAKARHDRSQQGKSIAWAVRIPATFIDHKSQTSKGSFQTVVMSQSEIIAWDTAMDCDVWEKLPFEVTDVQVFPCEIPTCSNDHVKAS